MKINSFINQHITFIDELLDIIYQFYHPIIYIFFYLCITLNNEGVIKKDSVAQLVEQYTFNVWVLGSNPSGITKKQLQKSCFFCFPLEEYPGVRFEKAQGKCAGIAGLRQSQRDHKEATPKELLFLFPIGRVPRVSIREGSWKVCGNSVITYNNKISYPG